MANLLKNQIIIDGLEYCNWNREILEDLWKGGVTAIHATLVYWENTEESFNKIIEVSKSNQKPLIVKDSNQKNIGVITQSDLLKAVIEGSDGE